MRALITPIFLATLAHAAAAESPSANAHVAEIVTFRLTEGSDATTFVSAARALEPFLKDTGGMIRRNLSQDDDGLWTDHIVWASRSDADRAAKSISTRPEAQPFMAMIAPDTVTMRHAPIHLQQE